MNIIHKIKDWALDQNSPKIFEENITDLKLT